MALWYAGPWSGTRLATWHPWPGSASWLAIWRPATLSRSWLQLRLRSPAAAVLQEAPAPGALIGLVLFIVFGFIVRGVTASHSAVSITPFPSASGVLATGAQNPQDGRGRAFVLQDGSGDAYQVALVKVIDPARGADQFTSPDSGKRFVGLVFKIKALTGSPQNEDANNDAVLVGSDGQNYSADFDGIAGYTNFDTGTIRVAQGDTVTGAVTFQVPNGITISKARGARSAGSV